MFGPVVLLSAMAATTAGAGENCVNQEVALRKAKLETWPALYRNKDVAGLSRFLTSDFVSIDADGRVTTRSEELEWLAANDWHPMNFKYTISQMSCPVVGTAVVTGIGRSSRAGPNGTSLYTYTSSNLFVLVGGEWRAAMSHISGARTTVLPK